MIHWLSAINWLSVAIAFAIYCVLGTLWFTVLFKKQYQLSLGRENEAQQNLAPIFIIGPTICSLLITLTSALLIYALGIDSYSEGIEFTFIVGIGYLVANTVTIAINPNIPRPILYGIISGAYHLTGLLIATTVFVTMK